MPKQRAHKCHAVGCEKTVKPELLMCGPHWRLVPYKLQLAVLETYRPGQEIDKQPTREYLDAAQAAIAAVKHKEDMKKEPETETETEPEAM